jgi:nucleoside-diphosphate-sugar epimerase
VSALAQPARVAVIGCGAAAALDVAALFRLGLRPALFVDPDLAAARRLARGAAIAATPGEALDRFDAAIVTGIGCASALHELVRAGKEVLCAPEALAAAAISNPAVAAPSSLLAPSHLRFAPAAERVRALLKAGQLGSLARFELRYGASPPPEARLPAYWDRRIAGGGVLVDPGVQLLDLVAWWIGPLSAESCADDSVGGVEAEAVAKIGAGGAEGIVELSRLRALRNSIVLTGTRGRLELDLDTLTLQDDSEVSGRDRDTRLPADARSERTLEFLHGRRIEQWLHRKESRIVPDGLVAANAIDTLIALYARRTPLVHAWEAQHERARAQSSLAGRAVLVTGATGFIGARLVEMLAGEKARITVAVRNLKRAARIARFDVRLVATELGKASDLDALTRGQEIVFSLAYDLERSGAANVAVHRSIADACARNGVGRFVHLSSIAVYDDWPSGSLDETSSRDGPGSEYKRAKRAMEIDLAERASGGTLASIVLQPTIVYGPFSNLWTDRLVERFLIGKVELPRDGLGSCNGVYVDDVVDALIAAACANNANADAYIISGAAPFEWRALFAAYSQALGRGLEYGDPPAGLEKSPSALAALKADPLAIARWPPLHWLLGVLRDRLGEERIERLRARVIAARARGGALVYRPADEDQRLYLSRGSCSIDKARRDLDFAPAFRPGEGLRRTQDYIRWRYLGASDAAQR